MKTPLYLKKLCEKAIIPSKGSIYAAGYDLHSIEDLIVPSKGKALVKTGIVYILKIRQLKFLKEIMVESHQDLVLLIKILLM